MQRKHAKEGLVVITLGIDDLSEKREKTLKLADGLLKKTSADSLVNLILDESDVVKEKKFPEMDRPAVYLFNREGKWKYFDSADLADGILDSWVERFLKAKR